MHQRSEDSHSSIGTYGLRSSISKEEMELLNNKCNDILQPKGDHDESNAFFKLIKLETSRRGNQFNPEFDEAVADTSRSKNELLRELQHSTQKRKMKKIHKMSGETDISYLDQYRSIQPALSSIKNTIDTQSTDKLETIASAKLVRYPDLNKHPRLINFLSHKLDIHYASLEPPTLNPKDQQPVEYSFPSKLIPIKSQPQRPPSPSPHLKVHQIIESRYNMRYIKKGDMRMSAEKLRTRSMQYQHLIKEQSTILMNNATLSKENKSKLGESLNRILRLVSEKKLRESPEPHLSKDLKKVMRSSSVKLPALEGLVNRRRKVK